MKKPLYSLSVLFIIFLVSLFFIRKASQNEDSIINVVTVFQNINISLPNIPKRHIYNENSYEKNLLLQFLHDEIPLEDSTGKLVYFSEFSEKGGLYYYIVDMDGDGQPEYSYWETGGNTFIRYMKDKGCFEVWLCARTDCYPIGNGVMIDLVANTSSWYTYMVYDSEANLIKETTYMYGWDGCKKIDGAEVTEEEWNKETEYLFEAYRNRPQPFSYEELYE